MSGTLTYRNRLIKSEGRCQWPARQPVRCLVPVSRSALRLETIPAIHRLVVGRPEGNHRFLAATRAYGGVHLTIGIAAPAAAAAALLVLPCSPALRATLRLVGKALFRIEVLFTLCEHEVCSAVPASKHFVSQILLPPFLPGIHCRQSKHTTDCRYLHQKFCRKIEKIPQNFPVNAERALVRQYSRAASEKFATNY